MKKTKQGVPDLNHLSSKSAGRKLPEVPIAAMEGLPCRHPSNKVFGTSSGYARCYECDAYVD